MPEFLSRLDPPRQTPETAEAANRLGWFMDNAARAVFATILGKVSPDASDLENQVHIFERLCRILPIDEWHHYPMLPQSVFAISDTLDNLLCAYGRKPLWESPIFREYDGLRKAGPLDERTLYGLVNMASLASFLNHTELSLPDDMDGKWEQALRDNDEQALYGDGHTDDPADIVKAREYYEAHRSRHAESPR